MKISKILAGMSAAALAASMLSVVSFADTVEDYVVPAAQIRDNTVYLCGDAAKGEDGPFNDKMADLAKYDTVTVTIKAEDATITDAAATGDPWIGGGLALNSESNGWNATEWSFQDAAKPLTFKATGNAGEYSVTLKASDTAKGLTSLFAADDTYAQVVLQDWSEETPLTVTGVTLSSSASTPTPDVSTDPELKAYLVFTDSSWAWGNWAPGTTGADDATVKGDGTYTVAINKGLLGGDDGVTDVTTNPAAGATVFCVDVIDARKSYDCAAIKATVDSIKMDGEDLAFDASKILTGNIEDDKDNFRIEIKNEYGNTKADPAIDPDAVVFENRLEVTFTLDMPEVIAPTPDSSVADSSVADSVADSSTAESVADSSVAPTTDSTGSTADSTASKAATDSSKKSVSTSSKAATNNSTTANPNTGAAALAAVGIALAGAAVVATKKRK